MNLREAFWPSADAVLLDAGREGEAAIARARIAVLLLVLASPAVTLVRHPESRRAAVALAVTLVFLAVAVAFVRLAGLPRARGWIGFVTVTADVTFISISHVLILLEGFDGRAVTSRATFGLYLLAIMAASLRQDGRTVTLAGALAASQWLGVIGWAMAAGRTTEPAQGVFSGGVSLPGQVGEIMLIAGVTALSQMIVRRAGALRLSSVRDSLTGLLSRAHFEERLATELIRSARQRRPIALAIIDLDFFKQVNDTYGHPTGDAVLRDVAGRLVNGVRRTDLSARIGGDEFALVLLDTSVADAALKLEEIRRAVASRAVMLRNGDTLNLTISAGVAVAPLDGDTAEALVAVADARLLSAKHAGRNRLVVSDRRTGEMLDDRLSPKSI